jgi:hypothetical protein
MLLFDAVDMHPTVEANVIPDNVGPVLHVRRAHESNSRITWGYAVPSHSLEHLYQQQSFPCTHGGMGGAPWPLPTRTDDPSLLRPRQVPDESHSNKFIQEGPGNSARVTYAQDAKAPNDVWKDVQWFLREYGFQ